MPNLKTPSTTNAAITAAWRLVALAGLAAIVSGCKSPPPADTDAYATIGTVSGLSAPVQFRLIGPDGAPLDEPDSAAGSLTLADAVRRAVTTEPALQAALARIQIAMADANQSRLLPNPVLNLILRFGPGKPQIEASLTQDFIAALQIPHRSSAADNRLRQAAAEAVTTALDVASEVTERYVASQSFAALAPILEQRSVLLDNLTTTAKAQLDAGEGTRGDVVTLEAQRSQLLVEIDRIRLSETEERLRLARLIGEPSSAATWTLDEWVTPSIGNQPETVWINAALQQRPEIQVVAWRLKALGDEEALVRLLPWEGANVGVDAQRDDKLFTGPSISTPIPIFDMGQARRGRVTAEQLEARNQLTLAKRKVVEEVRVAFRTLSASKDTLSRIHKDLIPFQEQRRQYAEDAFRAGQTDVTALFLAEQDLRLAQTQAIDVERQAATAFVRLQRAVGGIGVAASLVQAAAPVVDNTSNATTHAANLPIN